MSQHTTELTYHPNTLDLVIKNKEVMIDNVTLNVPVVKSIIYVSLLRCLPRKHRNFNTTREIMSL